jgi:uncharacterized membrane protein YsdA (DUF1294 family)
MDGVWDFFGLAVLYGLGINSYAYYLFRKDKRQAQQGGWRVPERSLFIAAYLGGGFGAWQGMQTFRHKTQQSRFLWGIRGAMVLNALCFLGLCYILFV